LAKQINFLNRWQYTDFEKGWVGFGSIRFMNDNKQIGALGYEPKTDRNSESLWGSEIKTQRVDGSVKVGYVFPEIPFRVLVFNQHIAGTSKRPIMVFENTT